MKKLMEIKRGFFFLKQELNIKESSPAWKQDEAQS